jgi:hypothetical protein
MKYGVVYNNIIIIIFLVYKIRAKLLKFIGSCCMHSFYKLK